MRSDLIKQITNYPDYWVGISGNIYSIKKGKEKQLKQHIVGSGYVGVVLCKNGKCKSFSVHRLVAQAWIPNPNKFTDVDHINEDKTDNRKNNLRWLQHKTNCCLRSKNEIINNKRKRVVYQYTLNGDFVKKWDYLRQIEKELGYSHRNIVKCCRGKYRQSYGFIWSYTPIPCRNTQP